MVEPLGQLLDMTLDLSVPEHEGAFYRVQLPPHGAWSRWFRPDEPCPFDQVLSVQLHNIDSYDDPRYAQVMRQFKIGESEDARDKET